MPFFLNASKIGFGNFISLNALIGGGGSLPSTSMCNFFQILWCLFSGMDMISLGGRQLVFIGSVYSTPLANSETPFKAVFSATS